MLVAIPLAVLVIVFVEAGGIAFALFVIAIGWLCMYELYRMLDRWRPLPIVGFAALAGMVLAARLRRPAPGRSRWRWPRCRCCSC